MGISKVGCSLTPKNERFDKLFRNFNEQSDIDIAIVSDRLFETFLGLFRRSYSELNKRQYAFISREIYRGYINERNLKLHIDYTVVGKTSRNITFNLLMKLRGVKYKCHSYF